MIKKRLKRFMAELFLFAQANAETSFREDPRVVVGRYTYGVTSETVLLFRQDDNVSIGSFCSIADGVRIIASGEHASWLVSSFPFHAFFLDNGVEVDTHTHGAVVVGNDVWIGSGSLILSGVSIGDGAIVGAGSVVTRDVPPYSVVYGVPSKIHRYRFSEEVVKELLKIRWWTWDDVLIRQRIPDFYGPIDDFVRKYKVTSQ